MKDLLQVNKKAYLQGQSRPRAPLPSLQGRPFVLLIVAFVGFFLFPSEEISTASAAGPAQQSQETEIAARISYTPNSAAGSKRRAAARTYPLPNLERTQLRYSAKRGIQFLRFPGLTSKLGGRFGLRTQTDDFVFLTIEPDIQAIAEEVVKAIRAPHAALVAMDPRTGRILALAEKSLSLRNAALHTGYPAASLFKIVTAAAAVERRGLSPESPIAFRGGTYTLNRSNYLPSKKWDRRIMSLGEAMGKSCNPAFARVALNYLSDSTLQEYATRFGFNLELPFEYALAASSANIPQDQYGLSRTAAGFGAVTLSPLHAASIASGVANGGLLPRPILIDRIVSAEGESIYHSDPEPVVRMVRPETAADLLAMMHYTTTEGTSRKEFMKGKQSVLPGIDVAAKTGTLSGQNPKGLNTWLIASAPMHRPEIALAVVVVNPGTTSSRASGVGRRFLQAYFKNLS